MSSRNYEYVWRFLAENDCAGADAVTSGMLCTICRKVLINAHSARCGCRFCLGCVTQYLSGASKFCPGDRDECCRKELMDIDKTVYVDHAMNQEISRLVVQCPRVGCKAREEVRRMEEHERGCRKKRVVQCPYSQIGCEERRIVRDKIGEHLDEEGESHAGLLMEVIGGLQSELGAMKREIARLAGQRRDQEIHVESRWQGEFTWRIDHWPAWRRAAHNDSRQQYRIFSDAFCLHEQGPRMCLSVRPDGCHGNNDLCIGWHLMRGPFDEHLTWPFRGAATLSVVDQHTGLDHASVKVASTECPNNDGWRRPVGDRNDAIYSKASIDLEELSRNEAVCREGRILVRCVVQILK